MKITNDQIKQLAVDHGFKLHSNGIDYDLKQYVYDFARALIAMAQEVPDLEWDNSAHYNQAYIESFGGEEDELSYGAFIESRSGKWYLDLPDHQSKGKFETLEEAKVYANDHNRNRVLSQLKYGEQQ